MFRIEDRIETTDDEFGTIKYVGDLPSSIWKNKDTALGIDWDNPNRGKHNGTIDGVRYFETIAATSGSFVKASSKKIRKERHDVWEALVKKYSEAHEFETMEIGTKTIEASGFDKLNESQSHFDQLSTVSLGRKHIYRAVKPENIHKHNLTALCNLKHLDLSFNIFNDFEQIWNALEYTPSLESLDLTGNRFIHINPISKTHTFFLKELKLSSTMINLRKVFELILPMFPNLEDLILSGNNYRNEDFDSIEVSNMRLNSLDLSFNELTSIPPLITESRIANLSLSDNRITTIPNKLLGEICSIDLRNNEISSWRSIDQICQTFPHMNDLRINGNPVFENLSIEEATLLLIGRLNCQGWKSGIITDKIVKLNGSYLSEDEITNAELYFISQVQREKLQYNLSTVRWKKLTEKYNLHAFERPTYSTTKNFLSDKKLNLKVHFDDGTIYERSFLKDNSVLRLKGAISKVTKKLFTDFDVYYYLNDMEKGERIVLDDDTATLSDFGIQNEQNLYIL